MLRLRHEVGARLIGEGEQSRLRHHRRGRADLRLTIQMHHDQRFFEAVGARLTCGQGEMPVATEAAFVAARDKPLLAVEIVLKGALGCAEARADVVERHAIASAAIE